MTEADFRAAKCEYCNKPITDNKYFTQAGTSRRWHWTCPVTEHCLRSSPNDLSGNVGVANQAGTTGISPAQDFRNQVAKQCGFPLQLKDREPTDAEVLSALQFALGPEAACLNFALDKIEKAMNPKIIEDCEIEDQEREENDIPYRLRDEGRASNGMGESYAERNA